MMIIASRVVRSLWGGMLSMLVFVPVLAQFESQQPDFSVTGGVSYLSLLEAYAPMPAMDTGWWYLVGLLQDQKGALHSLQFNIFRKKLWQDAAMGLGTIGFSYQENGQDYYLWTAYPDAAVSSVGAFDAPRTTKNEFSLTVSSPMLNYRFYHDPADTAHAVGQLGARYVLSASGRGRVGVTRLSPLNGKAAHYQWQATLVDRRGLLPEAHNGLVGNQSNHNSWELAVPKMKVQHWQMVITYDDGSEAREFSSASGADHLWFDRQVLYQADTTTSHAGLMQGVAQLRQTYGQAVSPAVDAKPLYRGTWMSFCLDEGWYKGFCGVAVAFWQPGVATGAMDSQLNATYGFANLYTAIKPSEPGDTLTAFLPEGDDRASVPMPYRIVNEAEKTFVSPRTGHHYAGRVYLHFNPGATLGAVLHAAAKGQPGPLWLRFDVQSRQTENLMFFVGNSFYEGAATVRLCQARGKCDETVTGTGFVEQMGYQ